MLDNLVCPVSHVRIDRNVVRTAGLMTTGLLVAYVLTGSAWLIVPVALDYVFRARMDGPPSPMGHVARFVAGRLGIPYRAMDKAPKVFASRIGVCFAGSAAIAHFAAPAAAPWIAGTLSLFTGMESLLDFCVGCVVYTYMALPLYRARAAVMAIPLFASFEDQMLIALASGFKAARMPPGARVVTEGEAGDRMFMLVSGRVEVYHEPPGASPVVVALYEPGSFFGEMALLTGEPRVASVRALTPIVVLTLLRSDFEAMLRDHPRMREMLERAVAERVAREASMQRGAS